jgi:tRNA(Arg) A34 adenosine deaminase TadA
MDIKYMKEAIRLSQLGVESGKGGPFGAVVVYKGEIIGRGSNEVTSSNDPTAHAEVVAIRNACKQIGTYQLTDCDIYTSCEPCPMCLGAIYWARPAKVYYACTKEDASQIGFDDQFIYEEINVIPSGRKIEFIQVLREEGLKSFEIWKEKGDKTLY